MKLTIKSQKELSEKELILKDFGESDKSTEKMTVALLTERVDTLETIVRILLGE